MIISATQHFAPSLRQLFNMWSCKLNELCHLEYMYRKIRSSPAWMLHIGLLYYKGGSGFFCEVSQLIHIEELQFLCVQGSGVARNIFGGAVIANHITK